MKVISIIIKDLKIVLSDKKAVVIILLMPVILMTILSFALKGSFASGGENIETIKVAVVKQYDEEQDSKMFLNLLSSDFISKEMGEATKEDLINNDLNIEKIFFEEFLQSDDVSKYINYRIESEEKATELLNNKEVSAVVILPEHFIYNMKINLLTPFRNKVNIDIITHPDRTFDGQIVKTVMESYSNSISSIIIGKNVLIETSMSNDVGTEKLNNLNDVMESMSDLIEGIKIEFEDVAVKDRKNITSQDYYSVAMMTMFILFAAGQGGRMLLEEKENGTYHRMTSAGTSKFSILLGKFVAVFIISAIQIFVMIFYSHFVLKVNWGNLISVILISLTASFAVAGLGTFVSAATYKSGNYKMANIFENVIIQDMALLGGSFFPVDILPKTIQNLNFLSLNGLALKSYIKTMMGYGLNDIINNILAMAVTGIVFSSVSVIILMGKVDIAHDKHNKIKNIKA